MALSTIFTAYFDIPEPPDKGLAKWRAGHPDWLPARYKEIEDSYNSVTWEWRHLQGIMALVTFGGLLGGATVYRVTALFEPNAYGGSHVTVNGTADVDTRQAIARAAKEFDVGGLY